MTLTNSASIVFYLLFFALLISFSYLGFYKKNKICAVLAILLPMLVAGFRFNVGTDYAAYYEMYNQVSNESSSEIMSRLRSGASEPLILLVISLCGNVLFGHWLFFAFFALITALFLYLSFKKFDEKMAWLLYSGAMLILFPLSFNAMRQIAAISVITFVLMNIIFDKEKRYLHYFLFTLLAVSIHYSTILFLPVLLVPLIAIKTNYKRLSFLITIALGVALVVLPPLTTLILEAGILPDKYANTFMQYESAAISFDLLIIGIIAVLAFITRKHFNSYTKETNRIVMTMMSCAVFYAGLGLFSAYIGRMADFFWPINIIALWLIIDRLEDKPQTKMIIFLIIPILYFVASYIIMGNSQIIPYQVML